jgi:pyruvoyl-dependent arginine decarboxylase (PvlArgDC)|tara:strand:- start:2334 stop:2492 length:159 start_codon:yes stop_codon:yes gene_type:complete
MRNSPLDVKINRFNKGILNLASVMPMDTPRVEKEDTWEDCLNLVFCVLRFLP